MGEQEERADTDLAERRRHALQIGLNLGDLRDYLHLCAEQGIDPREEVPPDSHYLLDMHHYTPKPIPEDVASFSGRDNSPQIMEGLPDMSPQERLANRRWTDETNDSFLIEQASREAGDIRRTPFFQYCDSQGIPAHLEMYYHREKIISALGRYGVRSIKGRSISACNTRDLWRERDRKYFQSYEKKYGVPHPKAPKPKRRKTY